MKLPKLTVGIVTYDHQKYLPKCIDSLLMQKYSGQLQIIIRDHSPDFEIAEMLEQKYDGITVIKGENTGHSGGHNALINESDADFYACLSADAFYDENCLAEAVLALVKTPIAGSAAIKLYRWDFANDKKTTVIDSAGLSATKAQRFTERGSGVDDAEKYGEQEEIFGTSGAAAVYRKTALEAIRYDDEYFDECLHYKNDIDLAYRLQWADWRAVFVPTAVAWHDRQVSDSKAKDMHTICNSAFGQRVVLYKNHSAGYSAAVQLQTAVHRFLRRAHATLRCPETMMRFGFFKKRLKQKRDHIPRVAEPSRIEAFFTD